jgi:hypothetical protein
MRPGSGAALQYARTRAAQTDAGTRTHGPDGIPQRPAHTCRRNATAIHARCNIRLHALRRVLRHRRRPAHHLSTRCAAATEPRKASCSATCIDQRSCTAAFRRDARTSAASASAITFVSRSRSAHWHPHQTLDLPYERRTRPDCLARPSTATATPARRPTAHRPVPRHQRTTQSYASHSPQAGGVDATLHMRAQPPLRLIPAHVQLRPHGPAGRAPPRSCTAAFRRDARTSAASAITLTFVSRSRSAHRHPHQQPLSTYQNAALVCAPVRCDGRARRRTARRPVPRHQRLRSRITRASHAAG